MYDEPPPAEAQPGVKYVVLRDPDDLPWTPLDDGLRALRVATQARDRLSDLIGDLIP